MNESAESNHNNLDALHGGESGTQSEADSLLCAIVLAADLDFADASVTGEAPGHDHALPGQRGTNGSKCAGCRAWRQARDYVRAIKAGRGTQETTRHRRYEKHANESEPRHKRCRMRHNAFEGQYACRAGVGSQDELLGSVGTTARTSGGLQGVH